MFLRIGISNDRVIPWTERRSKILAPQRERVLVIRVLGFWGNVGAGLGFHILGRRSARDPR